MLKLYENGQATGENVKTISKLRKWGHSAIEQDFFESIDDLDNCISRNEVTFWVFDAQVDDGNNNNFSFSVQETQMQDPSPTASIGSKRKKSRVAGNKEKDNDVNELKRAMHEVEEALRDGNANNKRRDYCNKKMP